MRLPPTRRLGGPLRTSNFQIPPDLVVKSQAIDIIDVIVQLIRRPHVVQTSSCNSKSRCEPLSTSEAHRFTTKSDGMCNAPCSQCKVAKSGWILLPKSDLIVGLLCQRQSG